MAKVSKKALRRRVRELERELGMLLMNKGSKRVRELEDEVLRLNEEMADRGRLIRVLQALNKAHHDAFTICREAHQDAFTICRDTIENAQKVLAGEVVEQGGADA